MTKDTGGRLYSQISSRAKFRVDLISLPNCGVFLFLQAFLQINWIQAFDIDIDKFRVLNFSQEPKTFTDTFSHSERATNSVTQTFEILEFKRLFF